MEKIKAKFSNLNLKKICLKFVLFIKKDERNNWRKGELTHFQIQKGEVTVYLAINM